MEELQGLRSQLSQCDQGLEQYKENDPETHKMMGERSCCQVGGAYLAVGSCSFRGSSHIHQGLPTAFIQ